MRTDGRKNEQVRIAKITRGYTKYAEGSVLVEVGDTKVICTASIGDRVPLSLKGQGEGWITAKYNMFPKSTGTRKVRDIARLRADGRTMEVQRLIGRVLKSVMDLKALDEKTIWIDRDAIQAGGGTRTTSITGTFTALVDVVNKSHEEKPFEVYPTRKFVSATSVGILNDEKILDLCYEEDSNAKVDMNVIATDEGEFMGIQGTGEELPLSRDDLNDLLDLAQKGIKRMVQVQKNALKMDALWIGTGGK